MKLVKIAFEFLEIEIKKSINLTIRISSRLNIQEVDHIFAIVILTVNWKMSQCFYDTQVL